MTPEYIALKLSLLPRFEVETLSRECREDGEFIVLDGRFSEAVGLEDQSTYLYTTDLRSVYGLLLAASGEQESRRFNQYWHTAITDPELMTSELYYFAANDDRQLLLILDPEIKWIRVDFTPQKALKSPVIGTDGRLLTKLEPYWEGDPIPLDSTIVTNGWDHEHCVFCMDRIDEEHSGFTSIGFEKGDDWACEWCFRNAVEYHDPRPLLISYAERDKAT